MTLKKLVFSGLLASSMILTACGGDASKVYPNGSGPNKDDGPNRSKPDGGATAKFITSHLAGTVAVALLQLNRTVDLALNKENAESLIKARDCQKITSTPTSIEVVTSYANCGVAARGGNWAGNEQIELAGGSNGLFNTLKTKSVSHRVTLASSRDEHKLQLELEITKSAHSRPGKAISYDFKETMMVESIGEATVSETNNNNDDGGGREATPRSFEGHIDVVLSGKIEIDPATKKVTGIAFTEPATVDGQRIVSSGRTNRIETITTLTLKPESNEFVPAVDGRITADFSAAQSIEVISANGRVGVKKDHVASVRMSPDMIDAAETRPMKLAANKPGFETILADLETLILPFFRLMN